MQVVSSTLAAVVEAANQLEDTVDAFDQVYSQAGFTITAVRDAADAGG